MRGIPDANMVSLGIEHMLEVGRTITIHVACPLQGQIIEPATTSRECWLLPIMPVGGETAQELSQGKEAMTCLDFANEIEPTAIWSQPCAEPAAAKTDFDIGRCCMHENPLVPQGWVSAAPLLGLESQPVCSKYP